MVLQRFASNPILRPQDIAPSAPGMKIECLLNPGVFRFDGKIWLLLRVAERPEQRPGIVSFPILENGAIRIMELDAGDPELDLSDPRVINYRGEDFLTTMSHLRLVCSEDGIHFHEPGGDYTPLFGASDYETYGIEDCRVCAIGNTYYLTYTAVSRHGVGVGMISTRDWRSFQRHGLILPPHNKDCALFGEPMNGKYYLLHRPSSPELGGNYIWLAESEDLLHWGDHKCLIHSRPGMWDEARVGAGASPILTEHGWLEIYHGANRNNRYCLGALMLDRNDPSRVLARSEQPLMEPEAPYELTGFFGNVVFTNGHLVDGDRLTIYYGASDEVICGAEFSIAEILKTLL